MLNLISEWRLDDGSGQTTVDSWSGGNTGTLGSTSSTDTNDPTWVTSGCVSGNCLSFDGSNDYVEVVGSNATTSNLLITGAITFGAWVKYSNTGTAGCILGRGPATGNNGNYGYSLTRNGSNKITFYVSSTTTTETFSSTSNIDTNWHYIIATWDGTTSTNGKKIYIDGLIDAQATSSFASMGAGSTRTFRIGETDNNFWPLGGLIDEARIFNAVIPISKIKELYYTGINNLLINNQIKVGEYNNKIKSLAKN